MFQAFFWYYVLKLTSKAESTGLSSITSLPRDNGAQRDIDVNGSPIRLKQGQLGDNGG